MSTRRELEKRLNEAWNKFNEKNESDSSADISEVALQWKKDRVKRADDFPDSYPTKADTEFNNDNDEIRKDYPHLELQAGAVPCPTCDGTGKSLDMDTDTYEMLDVDCPTCGGAGEIFEGAENKKSRHPDFYKAQAYFNSPEYKKSREKLEKRGADYARVKTETPNEEYPAPWRYTRSPEGIYTIYASNNKEVGAWLGQQRAEGLVDRANNTVNESDYGYMHDKERAAKARAFVDDLYDEDESFYIYGKLLDKPVDFDLHWKDLRQQTAGHGKLLQDRNGYIFLKTSRFNAEWLIKSRYFSDKYVLKTEAPLNEEYDNMDSKEADRIWRQWWTNTDVEILKNSIKKAADVARTTFDEMRDFLLFGDKWDAFDQDPASKDYDDSATTYKENEQYWKSINVPESTWDLIANYPLDQLNKLDENREKNESLDEANEINRLQDKLNRIEFRSEYVFIIPAWAISTLFNGDESGLSELEVEKIDIFLDEVQREYGEGHWSPETDFDAETKKEVWEPEFRTHNDIDNLGNDCYECKYTVFNK
jgi:ssDNA-binding Zn-finger/Zn-ribbon topoisomerase 1